LKAAYPHCAERIFDRVLLIEPNALSNILKGPMGRRIIAGERLDDQEAFPGAAAARQKRMAMVEADPVSVAGGVGQYAITSDGIGIVSVLGVLSQRFDWMAALCGWTTYEGLASTFAAMLADYRVRAILMDVDSPGGEAGGMPDAADQILAARSQKPVWAVANTFAASAAYALAGSAQKLYVPRLALVGSIGAVCVHVDQSVADKAYGERYTAIYSGARKIDGWEHAPLSEGARSAFQAGIDHCRDSFAELVGRQGRMTKAEAMATEAGIYHDQEAVAAGLADAVGSFDQALADLTSELNGTTRPSRATASTQETGMSKIVRNAASRANNGVSPAALSVPQGPRADSSDGDYEDTDDDDDEDENDGGGKKKDENGEDVDPNDEQEMIAPKPGETCSLCGQKMPGGESADAGDTDPDSPEEAGAHAHAAAASVDISARLTEIDQIMDLCASQNVSLADARGFIKSKTSLADVRAKIAASKAQASDEIEFDTRQPHNPNQTESRVQQMREAQAKVKGGLKSIFARNN